MNSIARSNRARWARARRQRLVAELQRLSRQTFRHCTGAVLCYGVPFHEGHAQQLSDGELQREIERLRRGLAGPQRPWSRPLGDGTAPAPLIGALAVGVVVGAMALGMWSGKVMGKEDRRRR